MGPIFEPMVFNRDLTVFNLKDEDGPQGSFWLLSYPFDARFSLC